MRAFATTSPLQHVARWALAALLLGVSGAALAQACSMPLPGEGSDDAPFEIGDVTAFTSMTDRFAELTNALSFTDACWSASFVLTDDVDLKGVDFVPVGRDGNRSRVNRATFNGTFDGGGHAIHHLRMDGDGIDSGKDRSGMALFQELAGATVRDVTFASPFARSPGYDVAVLAGAAADATIRDVTISGADVRGGAVVGVVAGRVTGGTWTNVSVLGSNVRVNDNMYTNRWRGGGLAGLLLLTSDLVVRDPDVDVSVDGLFQTGGAFGNVVAKDDTSSLIVTGGQVTTVVHGESETGGLVGTVKPDTTVAIEGTRFDVEVRPSPRLPGNATITHGGGIVGNVQGGALRIDESTVVADADLG
ncbi:MAG: hypothetical protein RI554_11480, partial [Trueperaceae bacterium]|nr:hypothetical protein [Trueperaceae bacterium]